MKADLTGVRIKTVSVTYERKLNLQDWNSGNLGITFWADILTGADPEVATRSLFAFAKAQVREQAMPLVVEFQKQFRKIVATLPAEAQKQFAPYFTQPSLELMFGLPEEEQSAD